MAKELTQAEFDTATALVAAVIAAPEDYTPEQVKFARGLAARLQRDGLKTLTTYHHHLTLSEIHKRRDRDPVTPAAGHNSRSVAAAARPGASNPLRQYFDRIQRLNAEIAALNADKSNVFQEVKAEGWDLAVFRTVLSRAQQQRQDVQERDELVRIYEQAIFGDGDGAA